MKIDEERFKEIEEQVKHLKKKYESITSLLGEIDSEMHEFYIAVKDLEDVLSSDGDQVTKE